MYLKLLTTYFMIRGVRELEVDEFVSDFDFIKGDCHKVDYYAWRHASKGLPIMLSCLTDISTHI